MNDFINLWETATGQPAPIIPNTEPLPDEPGRFVVHGGTSVNHWASKEYIRFPNGDWYRVGELVKTTPAEIRSGLFDGQRLERLIPRSETDL